MSTTTIVVPCFNEAERLSTLRFREFAAAHPDIRFLLVNDGSSDHTLVLLKQLAASFPRGFDVLDLQPNGGKAEAVRRGVLAAAASRPDYVGFWDADLATPLEAIPQFVGALERQSELLLAIGVRMPLLGHRIQRQPLRRLLGRVFCSVAALLLSTPLADTQCGAKLFRATPETLALFSQPFGSRWIFDVELLARLASMLPQMATTSLDELVYELPLDRWDDVAGSKVKSTDFLKAIAELSGIWWRYLRPGAAPYVAVATITAVENAAPDQRRRAA